MNIIYTLNNYKFIYIFTIFIKKKYRLKKFYVFNNIHKKNFLRKSKKKKNIFCFFKFFKIAFKL